MYKLRFNENDDVVLTTYFSSKENPQKDKTGASIFAPKNNINYIYPWYISVLHLKLNGVVIHDGLSQEFINEHERENLQFVYYNPEKYSLNDERYFALDLILQANKFNKVLLTDSSDLMIKRNPFEFMAENDLLYFGTDEPKMTRIRENPWCMKKLVEMMKSNINAVNVYESFLDFEYINAGVVGGAYNQLFAFNRALIELFMSIDSKNNNNMIAINYLLWKLDTRHYKGSPFTSRFKEYELHGDYYIVHK